MSACTQAVRCQHCSPGCFSVFLCWPWMHRLLARRVGGARRGRRRSWPTRRTPQVCRALLFRSDPASRPTRLVHLQNTTDNASAMPHRLHVPSLSVALQGDSHALPQRRSRLSASRRSPFPLISWSRSLAERIPERLKAGNDRGGGAVNCAFGRQPGGRAAVFNLRFPTSPRGGARAMLHRRYRAVIVHHITHQHAQKTWQTLI